MRSENQLKHMSLKAQHKLAAWRYRELKLVIILLLKIFLIALPASFFIFACAIGKPNPESLPKIPIKLYSLEPLKGGIFRRGLITPFSEIEGKHFIVISPEDFGELLTRCPVE